MDFERVNSLDGVFLTNRYLFAKNKKTGAYVKTSPTKVATYGETGIDEEAEVEERHRQVTKNVAGNNGVLNSK